jgi:hypothetical protein
VPKVKKMFENSSFGVLKSTAKIGKNFSDLRELDI